MSDASHPLQAELEQQLRLNLELRAALDDCRQAANAPLPLPLPLPALQRSQRADLAPLLQEQNLAPSWPAGFRLALPLPPSNASPPPVLFVPLHNGEQFCLSRPVHPEPLSWAELLALSPPWPAQ